MISNFRDEVERNGMGFYSAEVLSPPTAVIFRVTRYAPAETVRAIPIAGQSVVPITVPMPDLLNVKFISNALKTLTKE